MTMKSIWATILESKSQHPLSVDTIIHSITSEMYVDLKVKPHSEDNANTQAQ